MMDGFVIFNLGTDLGLFRLWTCVKYYLCNWWIVEDFKLLFFICQILFEWFQHNCCSCMRPSTTVSLFVTNIVLGLLKWWFYISYSAGMSVLCAMDTFIQSKRLYNASMCYDHHIAWASGWYEVKKKDIWSNFQPLNRTKSSNQWMF